MKGTVLVACNCDYGCPCNFQVTGAEITPGAVLPQGTIFKEAEFGSSRRYRVDPLGIDYSGRYTAVAPFDYRGP